jgi:hypothetical protein
VGSRTGCDLAVLPQLVHVMHDPGMEMRKHARSAMRSLMGLWTAVALAGCMSDAPRRPRTEDGCFIGGCSAELCSDRPDMVSPCIWREAYVCFRDATCARQPSGACGWTPTPELGACLASHEPASRSPAGSQP